ncbi:MAG TPA: ABC-2 family transporter protein [Candidatus Sulfotelmatobacter sp.]|nr:ABC-2 family transporter protein [Candidatus Sulfotelmatobacter sp.]
MLHALRVGGLYVRVAALNELQYRANFVVALFQSVLAIVVALVVLTLVYSHTTELNGWSEPELLCVLGIQILLGGVINAVIQPNMQRLATEIRDGKLDYALTRPADAQVLVSVREFRVWQLVDVIGGAIVLGVGVGRLHASPGLGEWLAFGALLLVGAVMLYCFWLILATGAFWIVRMEFLAELFEGIYQTGRWPIGIYPGWLRYTLTFLVPIAFAITVPAEALVFRLQWVTVATAVVFGVVLFTVSRWFWRRGLRRYSGASA